MLLLPSLFFLFALERYRQVSSMEATECAQDRGFPQGYLPYSMIVVTDTEKK